MIFLAIVCAPHLSELCGFCGRPHSAGPFALSGCILYTILSAPQPSDFSRLSKSAQKGRFLPFLSIYHLFPVYQNQSWVN
jgi:hypothetical protein